MILIHPRNYAVVLFTMCLLCVVGSELIRLLLGVGLPLMDKDVASSTGHVIVLLISSGFFLWKANDEEFLEWARQDALGEKIDETSEIYSELVSTMQVNGHVLGGDSRSV